MAVTKAGRIFIAATMGELNNLNFLFKD